MDISVLAEHPLILALVASIAIQIFFFIFAAILKTDIFTDLSYGITFIIVGWKVFYISGSSTEPKWILIALITLWGVRLAGYLLMRILVIKRDKRFDGIRENPVRFGIFWLFQGFSVWVILLPSVLMLSYVRDTAMFPLSWIGIFTALIGLLIETIADQQKFTFKQENPGMFISQGLWKYSRHPNYFGELLVWWGIFVFILPYLENIQYISIIGPIWITILLLFITGIPTIEKRYDRKYANDKFYKKYKSSTSLLIPLPPRS